MDDQFWGLSSFGRAIPLQGIGSRFDPGRFHHYGEMAERLKAAVLKTVEAHASQGSNPCLSAIHEEKKMLKLITEDTDFGTRESTETFSVQSDATNDTVTLIIGAEIEYNEIEFTYDEGGIATYVPYGEGYVEYDDGSPELQSVDASNAVVSECDEITDEEGKSLTIEKAAELLKCDVKELMSCIEDAEAATTDHVVEFLEEHYMKHGEN